MDEKVGQVSVWIILGIVLVASIILFFLLATGPGINLPSEGDSSLDVENFLEQCARGKVEEAVEIMLPQGGFVNPENTVVFDNIDVEYVCYNGGQFQPCVHQHPVLINEMKLEIAEHIYPEVVSCISRMKTEFESRGADVSLGSGGVELLIDMAEEEISVEITKDIGIDKKGETRRIDSVRFEIASPAYNLAKIAMEISDQEARYCYFEFVGYNALYPRYEIEPHTLSDQSKVYRIRDRKSGKEMNIGVRSCAIGPGGGLIRR